MRLSKFFERLRALLQDLLGERMMVSDDMEVVLRTKKRTRRIR